MSCASPCFAFADAVGWAGRTRSRRSRAAVQVVVLEQNRGQGAAPLDIVVRVDQFLGRRSRPSFAEHLADRRDGIPVARGHRYPKEAVDHAEIADDLHVAPVQAKDEPVLPREDF
jgi:hypothetical protein